MADGRALVAFVQRNTLMITGKDFRGLYEFLEHVFRNEALLKQAVTLGFGNYFIGYERLEFLGDRVLGLIVAEMLYETYPDEPEGDLAKRHSELVRAETLAVVAEKMDLGDYFIFPKSESNSIDRHSKTLLSDVCEACVAALYLDAGLPAAEHFIRKYWTPLMQESKLPPVDAKTRLQEWAQARKLPLPAYRVLSVTGPDHDPEFLMQVSVKGVKPVTAHGNSKRSAGQAAAAALLKVVNPHA